MKIRILTLFPEFFTSPIQTSILKRASELTDNPIEFQIVNIRDFTSDKHKTADDRPYGGGAGMVLKIEPIYQALESCSLTLPRKNEDGLPANAELLSRERVVLTSAKGQLFTQRKVEEYARLENLTIICGHYEGVDERVAQHLVDEEIRIGDYVLTGGEAAAMVIADAVTRLQPGVLGNELSAVHESHSEPGYLEHPHYTRPDEFMGWKVPQVLLSGNHAEIEEWKKQNSR